MDTDRHWDNTPHPEPGAWRVEESNFAEDALLSPSRSLEFTPSAQDQSKLLELLGLINYKILCGNILYVESGGIVYKIRYGVYWRSVFTGAEHYLLKCEETAG